ncbi:hypothetical protein Nepgr_029715 [Nepenthes gracilis]|uniref:Uncharacterized protein n=1 Tax=Nepenthes gracilis TaxID=150966 RepID=A0AAD3TFV0_NEPGR|nr:hypothetical protein Nepgr_029715 [Nepenthes gracilis]
MATTTSVKRTTPPGHTMPRKGISSNAYHGQYATSRSIVKLQTKSYHLGTFQQEVSNSMAPHHTSQHSKESNCNISLHRAVASRYSVSAAYQQGQLQPLDCCIIRITLHTFFMSMKLPSVDDNRVAHGVTAALMVTGRVVLQRECFCQRSSLAMGGLCVALPVLMLKYLLVGRM